MDVTDILIGLMLTLAYVAVFAVVGGAAQLLTGRNRPSGAAPALGFGLAVFVGWLAARLPGAGRLAACALAIALAASVIVLLRYRRSLSRDGRGMLGLGVATSVVASATMLPFVVNGRFGVLGPGFNDDFAPHLYWAWVLSTGSSLEGIADTNYPVGAHGIAAATSWATGGTPIEFGFVALILAVHPMLFLAGHAALRGAPGWIRWCGAALVAASYLVVAYTAQGSFKEPMMALLVLALALVLRDAAAGCGRLGLLTAALPILGMYGIYGKSAMPWVGGIIGIALLVSLVLHRRHFSRRVVVVAAAVALPVTAVAAWFALPIARDLLALSNVPGGNLPAHLPYEQVLGVWQSPDLRFPPAEVLRGGMLSGIAVVLALLGLWFLIRSPRWPLAVATLTCVALAVIARPSGPYFAAKALVIAAPFVSICVAAGLATVVQDREWHWRRPTPVTTILVGFAALVFIASGWSSVLALGSARVSSLDRDADLASIRERIDGEQTLFLGQDYFVYTKLRGGELSTLLPYSVENQAAIGAAPTKAVDRGHVIDWDAISPESLDLVRYVVLPRSAMQSEPYENFKFVERSSTYALYERKGPTEPRSSIDDPLGIGARLDCAGNPEHAAIAASDGQARVRTPPVTLDATWTRHDSTPVDAGVAPLGEPLHLPLAALRPGSWDLAVQYASPGSLTIRGADLDVTLPADPDLIGQYWHVGRLTVGKEPAELVFEGEPAEARLQRLPLSIANVVAVAADRGYETVPLKRACGRFVDWYRITGAP